jgi:CBS domain-containing protein
MPATVNDLIQSKAEPVTITADATLRDALGPMIAHNYSQLAVIDADQRPIGIVTSDSIIRALNNFGITLDGLRVYDAMLKRGNTYRPEDDLFDLLDDLKDAYAVLVVDAAGKLIGIVTSYDSTEYFRQRTQDMMFVQDIEEMIKSYINLAFIDSHGEIDTVAQQRAIEEITPSNTELRKKFQKALQRYLELHGGAGQLNDTWVTDAFGTHFGHKEPVNAFEQLTLAQYNQLFLHPNRWSKYAPILSVDRKAIEKLLDSVRKTRNMLAHLRSDLTLQQRDELQFCKDWLARHESALAATFAPPTLIVSQPPISSMPIETTPVDIALISPDVAPLDEISTTDESRYTGLIRYLQEQPIETERLPLTFSDIEGLIGGQRLPESARKHRAWWANDTVSHAQSQQWLDVGWRVAGLSMTDERVTFARSRERERAYIDFFSALLSELKREAPETFRIGSPDGQSWINAGWIFNGISFNFAFTQTKRFRVELYIDVGDKEANKRIFDALLSRREALEDAFGEPLSWERIDDKRASRLARYYPGNIADNKGTLANLRARAVEGMIRFRRVLVPHLVAVVKELGLDLPASSGYREESDRLLEPTP